LFRKHIAISQATTRGAAFAMFTLPVNRRRWFRFGLRTLLIGVTVLCVWLGIKVNAARRQHEVVQAILQAGGTVAYDYQTVPSGDPDSFNINRNATLSAPDWLRSIFGGDFFCNVIYVGFQGTGANFELARLADLPSIRRIIIRSIPATPSVEKSELHLRDDDLAVFGKLSQLQELRLQGQEIEGAGLHSLVGLKHLKLMALYDTFINDAGLEQIGKLTTLKNLVLTANRISDAGLQKLSTIPILNLDLMGPSIAQISDSRLEALSRLDNLDVLSFHKCHFIDENSLKRLQKMAQLKGLNFIECDITDSGLQNLGGFTNLLSVHIEKSHATAQGVRELQQALPKATIVGP
jgi:hypothetical protein